MPPALATKAVLDIDALWDSEDERRRLQQIVDARYVAMLGALHALVAEVFDLDLERFRLDDAATRRILYEAGQRVVRIDETTRQALADLLQQGQELGLSDWEIANGSERAGFPGIDGLFKTTWAGRAATIARTEIAHAQTRAALDRYQASGVVDRVKIVDGDQDAGCAARNGKIVPISQQPGLLHPNCSLSLIPVLREGL